MAAFRASPFYAWLRKYLPFNLRSSLRMTLRATKTALFSIHPLLWGGLVPLGLALWALFRKNTHLPKGRLTVASVLLYLYFCISFFQIVGMPTLAAWQRTASLGMPIFHPILRLTPFSRGIPDDFLANIWLFVPFGLLCPWVSRAYASAKRMALCGFGLSLFIELAQMFTPRRTTDIDDLLANTAGAVLGYACFWLLARLLRRKKAPNADNAGNGTNTPNASLSTVNTFEANHIGTPARGSFFAAWPPALMTLALVLGFFQ